MPIASPWLRRQNRRMMWLLVVLLALPAVGAVVWFFMTWDARAFMLMILMVLANIVNVINPLVMKRLKRRVTEHRGLLCTRCLYELRGLEPEGRCPECGQAYTFEQTTEAWARDFGSGVLGEQVPKS